VVALLTGVTRSDMEELRKQFLSAMYPLPWIVARLDALLRTSPAKGDRPGPPAGTVIGGHRGDRHDPECDQGHCSSRSALLTCNLPEEHSTCLSLLCKQY
jgi:hypothetical protein